MDMFPSFYDKHERIWSGPKVEAFYDYDCSIGRIMFNNMKNNPRNICQISESDGVTLTNGEVLTSAIRVAQHFKKMRLRHDDVIGIVAKNTTQLLPVGVACFLNATPLHAVNAVLDEKTLTHMFDLTKPKVIFCDGLDYEKVNRATRKLKPLIYTLIDHLEGVPKVQDLLEPTKTELFYKPESLALGGDQTMAILCSSGTTGMPKAVTLSNNRITNGVSMNIITCDDIVFSSSCLDWISGLMTMLISCTLGCTRIIVNKPFSPELTVEIVHKYKVTFLGVAPRHVAALVKCPTATTDKLSTVRYCLTGGGSISLATLQAIQNIMKHTIVSFGYALTEVGGVSTNFGLGQATSVGKVVAGLRVRIVDDNGKNLGPNEVGEIYAHHGIAWSGYYGNPMETQRMQDSLGWFHTGDLGYFDDNKFLYIVDRKKDILKYQGMHYWPTEIEECIAELPDVMDVCVVGIYDESNGDCASALVVTVKGKNLKEQDIKDYVKKRLILAHKQLNGGVLFVDKLPQNDNGKTVRKEAKALYMSSKGVVDR